MYRKLKHITEAVDYLIGMVGERSIKKKVYREEAGGIEVRMPV